MPIFDNELVDSSANRNPNPQLPGAPKPVLGSPTVRDVNVSLPTGGTPSGGQFNGLTISQLSQIGLAARDSGSWDSPMMMVPRSELLDNQRYGTYVRGVDLENVYSLTQPWYKQLGNGIAKFAGTGVGTFAQSFATIPNTIAAAKNGSFSELAGEGGYESDIDQWVKNLEDKFPNYVSRWEREHPYRTMIPFMRGSANFWGDKIIKNLGFTAGAIGGALVQDAAIAYATAGLGEIPLIAAQIGKASLWLNKVMTGTNRLDSVLDTARAIGKSEKALTNLVSLGRAAEATKLANGFRYGLTVYGSARTEAAVEARDGYRQVKDELTRQYKQQNDGAEPEGADLAEIESYATDAMNTRFGINMALLTLSNTVQFGSLFRSFTNSAKGVPGTFERSLGDAGRVGLAEGSLDVFEKKAVSTGARLWDAVKPSLKNVLAEGAYEEGGQFATEKGTYDYFTRKYKDLKDPAKRETWNNLNEVVKSTNFGLAEQFGSTEGIQNMLIGSISALITGGISGRVEKALGKMGDNQRLQTTINVLNRYGLTGILQNQYSDTLNSANIAREMDEAAKSGNVFKYKNLKHDQFFSFVSSRIPAGLHDVTVEQLDMLKDLDKAEFEKTFGMDFNESSKKTVTEYVDSLIKKANGIKDTYDSLNFTFQNPFTSRISPKDEAEIEENFQYDTFEEWKTNLAYYAAIAPDANDRLSNIQEDLYKINPLLNNDKVSSLTNREGLKETAELYEQKAKSLGESITELTTPSEKKDIRNQIKSLRTLSERINLALNKGELDIKTFENVLNFELGGQKGVDEKLIPAAKIAEIYSLGADINGINQLKKDAAESFDNLSSEKGFEKFFGEAKKMADEQDVEVEKEEAQPTTPTEKPSEFVNKAGAKEAPQVDREYELGKITPAKVKKVADDRYEVTSPYGETTFYPTKEDADEAAEEINANLEALSKMKVLAINDDGTLKVEDASGNIQNIDPAKLTGYERIQTAQEKLIEKKEELERQQSEIENNSGSVTTIDSSLEFGEREPAKREVSALFTGGITESETYADPTKSAPHVIRSRRFLNIVKNNRNRGNVKAILVTPNQEAALGLTGLAALSYKVDVEKMTPEELKEFNATIRKPDTGLVAQVFVVQKGNKLFFADEAGNPMNEVGTQVDLNRVVFQTIPTPALYDSKKNPRFRSNQEAEAKAYSEAWAKYREQLMAAPETAFTIYDFRISRGIPIVKEVPAVDSDGNPILNAEGKQLMDYEKNHVGDVLVPEDKINNSNGLIVVSITGEIVHNGLPINVLRGTPVLQYGDTLQVLNNRRFNRSEARVIFRLLSELSKGFALNSNLEDSYVNFLQNVLHWKQGKNPSKNQVYINPNSMELRIAGKDIPLSEVSEREEEIMDELLKTFSNVNNKTIKSDYPFTEYFINEQDAIESREWPNYQSYLLSATYPDGAKRSISDTPLYTSVAKPTAATPYSYMQKYATLEGLELDVQYTAPVEQAAAEGKLIVDGYVIDNETPNTFPLRKELGSFQFKAEKLPNGKISVELLDTEDTGNVVAKIASNADLVNNEIVKKLKDIGLYDPIKDVAKSNEDLVGDYLANLAAVTIESKMNAKPAEAPEAPAAEEPKPEEPTTLYNNEGTTGPSTEFRVVAKGEKKQDRIDDLDLAEFKKWAAEKVPGIPYEVLDNIIRANPDVTAWGAFENGVAKFYKSATRGTEYHEIFEGIWKGFLSPGEREALLNEFKSKSGTFLDRASGRQIEYAAATDKEAKERIADDFGDFRVGKLPARSLSEMILKFFRAIINFFKSFNSKPTLKDQLFKQIELGKFKESTLPDTVKNDLAEYKEIEGLSERQAAQFVEDMTARVAGLVFLKAKKFLYSPERVTSKQIFDEVEQMYLREGESQGWTGVNKRTKLGDYRWNALVQRTKEKLRTLGVDFNQEDRLSLNDENTNKNDYAPEAFTVDVKKTASFDVKFTLATLYKAKAMDQSNSLGLQMPDAEISTEALGYKLLNFSTAFATIIDKLSNTSDVTTMVDKLAELASNDADYVRMFKRLGGELKDKSMPYDNFKAEDWKFFISFFQTFTKQKPDALVQRMAGRETFTTSANIQTAARQQVNNWVTNMKVLSRTSKGAIFYDSKTETYKVNVDKLKEMPIGTPKQMIEFLEQIGITFDNDTYKKLKSYGGDRSQKSQFANAVKDIRAFLQKAPDILTVTSQTLGITPQLNTLGRLYVNANNPNQDITYFGIERKRMQAFVDNNTASVFENEFNESATLDELLEKRPELRDMFSSNSQILKKGGLYFDKEGNRIREIKVMTIQGIDNMDAGQGKSISKLSLGERFSLEINQNLNGNYYVLIPADSSTEWMMNIGNQISYQEFVDGKAWGKIYNIYKGYLMDDIMLARDYKERGKLNNVKAKAKELRFFNDILRPSILDKINSMVADKSVSMEDITKFVNENEKLINQDVALFLNNMVDKTFDILKQNGELVATEGGMRWQNLDNTFARDNGINKNDAIIEDVVKQVLLFSRANYTINNIEYHKMIFGDPLQFSTEKGKFDETKRIKSFLSPRRTTFDSEFFDNFLNDNMNEVAGMMLKPGDPGYHKHKRYTRTATLKDPIVASMLANTIGAYDSNKESDAASWLMDNTFREVKLKNGQWTDEAEDFHQWQMAYTRKKLAVKGKYVYTSPELQAYDERLTASVSPRYVLEVLKPIVSGVKYNANSINLVLDKFSQMPIYYSMVEGTNLEELYLQMMNQGYGYVIVESGRKVGAEGLQSIYNPDGTFNKEAFNNKVDVPWKAYGIQVENIYDEGKEQTRGSQLTKLVSLDLFANGEVFGATGARAEYIRNLYKRNVSDLDKLHANAYKRLLNKLGIVDNGQGFELEDKQALSTVLVYEMFRRELSENAKDTVHLDENKQFRIPFEASPSYVQIRNILYAMIDKSINSPKMGGKPKVQTPVTMWESAKEGRTLLLKTDEGYKKISREEYNALSEDDQKKVRLGSDTLKFYTKDKPYMEVMLPHWFKDKLAHKKFKTDKELLDYINNTPDGKKILKGIGFRIPTQALSSIDVFVVKGFLPAYMGDTVVVPTEIVTKAGSDFDIDKLNTYLRNIYIDKNGDIRLVKYKGSEEATKEFFTKVYEDTIQAELDRIGEFEGFRDRLFSVLVDLEGVTDFSPESVNAAINENDIDFFYDHINLIKEIVNQAADSNIDASEYIAQQIENLANKKTKLTKKLLNDTLKTEFVEDMYTRSLQNEYYDSLEEIITLPENFIRLITPVGDGGLKKIADELDELTGDKEANVKNKILDANYMTTLRHAFLTGKAWVGIGAVNITNQSLTQKTKTYIDPEKIKNVSDFDKKFLGDGTILLPHNTVDINGEQRISLSGVMDADGKRYISDGLSGYITSFVDVAKDPYILKIIKSNKVVGTFMFMQRIGVPIRTAALFMNQPIITEYIKLVEGRNARGLFGAKNIKDILNRFPVKDKTTAEVAEAIDLDNLANNIKEFAEKREFTSLQKNAQQVLVFEQFLRLAKMAQYSFKFTQAINYDTTKVKSADALGKKIFKTEMAEAQNIITSAQDVLDNSHIGQQKKVLSLSVDAMGAALVLDQERFKAITDKILDSYKQRDFISEDDYDRVSNKVRASFLDYVIQTQTGLNAAIKPLLINADTAVATRLAEAKRLYSNELPILSQLEVRFDRENGIHTVTLLANVKDAASENMYIGMMRELRNKSQTNQLYKDLVTLSILQGTYQTAVSIKNIIPIEDYSVIVAPVISGLVVTKDMDAFADGMFQRNNWNDDMIVTPLSQVFFRATTQQPIYNDIAGNAVYEYISQVFPKIESLGIQPLQRKVLYLDENYDNEVIESGDYVKIRRVVSNKNGGELVDVVKGTGISSKAYAIMKKAGNPIISQVLGYQKVKYPDGTPLTIGVKNYKGEIETKYVYKLINLYGEGAFGSEYYTDFRPSVVDNNTVRIKNEIPDNDIIAALSQDIKVDDIIQQSPAPTTDIKVDKKTEEVSEQPSQLLDTNPENLEGADDSAPCKQ